MAAALALFSTSTSPDATVLQINDSKSWRGSGRHLTTDGDGQSMNGLDFVTFHLLYVTLYLNQGSAG